MAKWKFRKGHEYWGIETPVGKGWREAKFIFNTRIDAELAWGGMFGLPSRLMRYTYMGAGKLVRKPPRKGER